MAMPGTTSFAAVTPSRIPLLRAGDCLSRDEFERRYEATPDIRHAELIEGKVYVPPPISLDEHASPQSDLLTVFGHYRAATPGVRSSAPTSIRMDLKNMPEPDACLFIQPEYGGQARKSGRYLSGAPELIAEISYTSASFDLHDKFEVYLRNGVREYIVWRTFDQAIDYFILRGTEYVRLAPDERACYRSEVFPGLWLDTNNLLSGDLAAVLKFVQEGIASPEHAEFVNRLQAAAAQPSR
jgi:putative restriction endonuclease